MLASFDGISVRIFKDLLKISAIICNIPTAQIENHFKNFEQNFIEIPIPNQMNSVCHNLGYFENTTLMTSQDEETRMAFYKEFGYIVFALSRH